MGRVPPRADVPCSGCEHYRYRQQAGQWIGYADILIWAPIRELSVRFGVSRALRQLIVFRLPGLMRLPIVRRALLGGV